MAESELLFVYRTLRTSNSPIPVLRANFCALQVSGAFVLVPTALKRHWPRIGLTAACRCRVQRRREVARLPILSYSIHPVLYFFRCPQVNGLGVWGGHF